MKKLFVLVLFFLMLLSLISCNSFADSVISNENNWFSNAINQLPQGIINFFLGTVSSIINEFVANAIISNIEFYLSQFSALIQNGDPVFNDPTVGVIYNITRAVGYNLAIALFLCGLSKNAIYFEAVSWEVVLKAGFMLILGKYLIDSGKNILKIICDINTSLCSEILGSTSSDIVGVFNLNSAYGSAFSGVSNNNQAISSGILFVVFAVIALFAVVSVFIVLILRQIQLAVLICVAPLFFATIVADVSNDIFKSFIKNFFAVAFQTTFMSIALAIFCGSIKGYLIGSAVGMGGGFVGLLIGLIGLSFYMVKMPSTIRNILGAGDGGSGINIASIAGLFK